MLTVSTEGEQTAKSPLDEGFTELEPTINESTEEAEMSSTSLSTISRDQYDLVAASCPSQEKDNLVLGQLKRRLDDEEDEGVARNSSMEDGDLLQSSVETEKQADLHIKPASQQTCEAKDERPEELLNAADDKIIRKLSLQEDSEVCGIPVLERQSPDRPAEGGEDRLRKNYESEMKSWLLKRMQIPIEGPNFTHLKYKLMDFYVLVMLRERILNESKCISVEKNHIYSCILHFEFNETPIFSSLNQMS